MKITINRVDSKPVAIAAFADKHSLEMEVNEREPVVTADVKEGSVTQVSLSRFYASFKGAEVKGNGTLASPTGNGKTVKAAIKDYAKQIQGKTLVLDAGSDGRKEIQVPKKLHCQGISLK